MSILPYLIRLWAEKEPILLPNLVIELKNFQERNVVITEMQSLFASVRGDSLKDKFSWECVALYQTLLGLVIPREVFPRSDLNSPLFPGLLFFYSPYFFLEIWINLPTGTHHQNIFSKHMGKLGVIRLS